jgi:DNA repair protein RadA/Sms
VAATAIRRPLQSLAQTAPVLSLADIEAIDVPRFGTGIEEFDRVLGGPGAGRRGADRRRPGIGKSTCCCRRWPISPS